MPLLEEIERLLPAFLADNDLYVVDITIKPSKVMQKITILLDKDEGITIDECASVSRRLATVLEAEEIIEGSYNLEVSSPGLDQPLKLPRQYTKNLGRDLKVTLRSGEIITGKLTAAENDHIVILPPPVKKKKAPKEEPEITDPSVKIELTEISKALIQVSFK
jgi:ribosome maturation factor RimP